MEVVEACANGFIGCLLLAVERQFGLGQPVFVALAGRMAANLDRDSSLASSRSRLSLLSINLLNS